MHIAIVTGPFAPLPPVGCGAVEILWQGLAHEFARAGHAVSLICRGHPSQLAEHEAQGVHYRRRFRFTRSGRRGVDLAQDFAYSAGILGSLPEADILVSNTFWLPYLAPRLKPTGGRVVVNVARMPKGQFFLYRQAARFAAVSRAVAERIGADHPELFAKTRIIPNPIATDIFRPPAQPRDYAGLKTILYTGRLHPEKGIGLLIGAFARLASRHRDIKLRLVGPWRVEEGGGGGPYRAKLQRKAEGYPVELAEPITSPEHLAEELHAAHVYCYPSLADAGESFGVAPLEAMGTGLPVVVSDLACFREFIAHGVNGLVFDHRRPEAEQRLAATLETLITQPELRTPLGQQAALRAAAFSYPAIAAQYLDDFKTLIETRHG